MKNKSFPHNTISGTLFHRSRWFYIGLILLFIAALISLFLSVPLRYVTEYGNKIFSEVKAETSNATEKEMFEKVTVANNQNTKAPEVKKKLPFPSRFPNDRSESSLSQRDQTKNSEAKALSLENGYSENPKRIVISKVGIDSAIENPTKPNINVLDDSLTRGVVHYPGSFLGQNGNVLLLGHSSHLKVVYNKAYRSFNDINNLSRGDLIRVYSDSRLYTYRVKTVTLKKNSEVKVDLNSDKSMLTLVTCDNFGAKEDRYIVEAELIGSDII